ncbi:hypothetical protein Tco_1080046 [Tanacetum coccineum]|uniref:Uncharacterized protein n=1 Tax=Tanacetum coccineum TaxID=301880 RepID=A0ABQ5HTL2_9ASTR
MIACVEKTAQNADFYQIIDYLTGCSINYSLLVDPDLIGPWLQQFWATASLRVINDVPHIRAMVAGKKILISEETIRADLLFDDAHGVDCFPKQVIWDVLRDIGYEGNLAQLTFSKPLFSPQWKYLVHVLLHCLSPKSTSWEQFGTNIASALVGLATNQKFNFSLMIMNGMLGHISNGTPFLMYPRFIQLFLNKQLEGVARPQDFIPSVTLPSKIFTFMRKHSPKFSCRITPLTPPMLEVVTALAAEEEHSTSPHSRAASSARDAQGTPTQSAAQASISQGTADIQGTDNSQGTATLQGTAASQGTADTQGTAQALGTDEVQGTNTAQGATAIPKSPNDYTPTDASQTSGGDEGLLDLYALNREVRRLKKQTLSQAKQILKLKTKLKKLSKFVQPVVKHHAFWVESQNLKKKRKKQKKQKKHKKKVSSVKLGRNKEEDTLSEEHYVQDDHTADPFFEDIVDKDAAVTPDLERKSDETEEIERKSDETEEINVEEKEGSNVKSGDTEELDLETFQSTARQSTITPRTLNFEDEAGPSSPIRPTQNIEPEEQFKVDEVLAAISRPRALETSNDEEVARKIQAEWDAEEERKRLEELKKAKPKTTSLAQERNQMMNFLKGQGYKNLQKLKYPQMKELYDKVQESIKDSFKDFIPMGSEKEREMLKEREAKRLLRKRKATISEEQPSKYFEKSAQDKESLEGISMITELQVIDLLLYRVVQSYYEHIPPTGLGLILLGDLTTIWETPETSDDDFWKNQEDWEIIRWRLNESSGVHTLELEDGTMIHMLAERRYPLSRELMIRMLDHGMEVEDESEIAITLIHLFILWTTEDGVTFQDTQTDCVQDTAQRMKLKRLKASTALKTRQTDAEQRRPTIKKLEVEQVDFKLGEDCWEMQNITKKFLEYGDHGMSDVKEDEGNEGNNDNEGNNNND